MKCGCVTLSPADHAAWSHPGGRHPFHRQTRDDPRPAAEGGAGVRHPRAEHPVSEAGPQLAQGPGAASEAGRAGGEFSEEPAAIFNATTDV